MTYDTLNAGNRLVSRLKTLNGMRSMMLEFNVTSDGHYKWFNGNPVEVQVGNRSLPLDAELFDAIYEYVMRHIKETENAFHDM